MGKLKARSVPLSTPTAAPHPNARFHAADKARDIDPFGAATSLVDGVASVGSEATSAAAGALSTATSAAGAVATGVAGKLSDLENDIADKLAKALGIKQFYSLHLSDMCEGDFTPNATDANAGFNATKCTRAFDYGEFHLALSRYLSLLTSREKAVGPSPWLIHVSRAQVS